MTPQELYAILDAAGCDYEVVQIFDGMRSINFEVSEEEEEQDAQHGIIFD
jgi:nicotinamidase-related amidase